MLFLKFSTQSDLVCFPTNFLVAGFPAGADDTLPPGAVASVSLPPELFADVIRDPVGVFFTLYTEPTLFPIRLPMRMENDSTTLRSEVASPIIAATVGPGLDFSNLDPPVVINLRLVEINDSVSDTVRGLIKSSRRGHAMPIQLDLIRPQEMLCKFPGCLQRHNHCTCSVHWMRGVAYPIQRPQEMLREALGNTEGSKE